MAPFNPTDKKYQVKDEFPPNKESTWKFPPEKDGWTLAHNSLRKEMRDLVLAVEEAKNRGTSQQWEVNCIKSAWDCHYEHIHGHHHNEDDVFVPFLSERFVYPEKTVSDHEDLVKRLDKISSYVQLLEEGSQLNNLFDELVSYEKMMIQHLEEEENQCLPLMRAYFKPEEVGPKVQEIVGKGPKVEMGSFISCLGEEKFRKEFMVQEGIPGFVWFIDFKFRVKLFQERFVKQIVALKMNEEPKTGSSGLFTWIAKKISKK